MNNVSVEHLVSKTNDNYEGHPNLSLCRLLTCRDLIQSISRRKRYI